jgi:ribosomal protein S3
MKQYNHILQKDQQAKKLLTHFFQHFLYSTPQVAHAPGRVSFRMYIHQNTELKPTKAAPEQYNLDKFKTFLSRVYGGNKKIDLQVMPLSAPYLNAEIAAQYIVLSSKKRPFTSLTNRFLKQTPLTDVVAGMKLQVSGRLSRRKGAGRKSRITRQKGKLGFASYTSRVEAAKCEFKNRNGKIGVVVWIRSGGRRLVPGYGREGRMRAFIQNWRDRRLADQGQDQKVLQ